ncbi:hypothetical protein NDU88_000502 [Pleurodeles waltl]|uniref:Uncharacterized protein n=1 Tax=Pleurodeles waltl TaxID=8319 RepID=A0AAV7P1I4_PLEWA|nr:hypothetical protein NDU88_000502 [Pleurodeles waltl]
MPRGYVHGCPRARGYFRYCLVRPESSFHNAEDHRDARYCRAHQSLGNRGGKEVTAADAATTGAEEDGRADRDVGRQEFRTDTAAKQQTGRSGRRRTLKPATFLETHGLTRLVEVKRIEGDMDIPMVEENVYEMYEDVCEITFGAISEQDWRNALEDDEELIRVVEA